MPTADTALAQFTSPRRLRLSTREQQWLEQAEAGTVSLRGEPLQHWRWRPAAGAPVRGRVLLVHGWESRAAHLAPLAQALQAAGFDAVAFDGLAHGASGGSRTSVVHQAASLRAVADALGGVDATVGHSFGSAASLLAFADGLAVRASVHLCGPVVLTRLVEAYADAVGLAGETRQAFLQGMDAHIGRPLASVDAVCGGARRDHPGLVLHDPQDAEVPVQESRRLVAGWPRATLVEVPDVGHRRILASEAVVARVVDFLRQALA